MKRLAVGLLLPESAPFYQKTLGLIPAECSDAKLQCFFVSGKQVVELDGGETQAPGNSVEAVGFLTSNVAAMRDFLQAQGLHPGKIRAAGKFASSVEVTDPEGHQILFVQQDKTAYFMDHDPRVSSHLIHAGFIVRDREKMEHFYKDILGFRPYWHGGMKDDETSWVSLQVPDGTDWLEFMLYDPTGKDKHFLGVMNHIALGVTDIQAAKAQLIANGLKLTEEPKLGRDGKWQLNVYDPDETRVEFMEFTPKEKPCCSDFTAPHPKP